MPNRLKKTAAKRLQEAQKKPEAAERKQAVLRTQSRCLQVKLKGQDKKKKPEISIPDMFLASPAGTHLFLLDGLKTVQPDVCGNTCLQLQQRKPG